MQKDRNVMPAVLLSIICLVTTLLLALTNSVTAPVIAALEAQAEKAQMEQIFPDGETFTPYIPSEIEDDALSEAGGNVDKIYIAKDSSDTIIGYIFISSSQGYAGLIKAAVGIDSQGSLVSSSFTAADETPGLGKKVEEDRFEQAFTGLATSDDLLVSASGSGQIDAISGATISSKGAVSAVNQAMRAYRELFSKGESA
jgi:Na+-translocating ferredoxin:NAD+ oxidoreductase subunit G